jgi:glycosyltransferase involved in cell wall biosynthesis
MTAALFFHPEGYTTSGPRLMGRQAAGESFLRGFITHARTDAFWVHAAQIEHARDFASAVRALGRQEPVCFIDKANLREMAQPGVLYLPGPNLGAFAWPRAVHGQDAWSLCGITHTTASILSMDAITDLLTAPVQPWDALICTSHAVRDNVRRVLQAQADYLARRLSAQRVVLPQLPVIPLGLHTRDFQFSPAQRETARIAIGADAATLVVLFAGRLSFHAKAHPLAMYQALQIASRLLPSGQRLLLVECGWHANSSIAAAYAEASRMACPDVRVVPLDGRDSANRQTAWASADVFCSLSDNIQETFGLVPIKAMAAGLPVVASDWDGYRDTVRDGVDGFLVPTLMPGAGLGNDLALCHALAIDTYDLYCGQTCALVAVDVEATAQAFIRLFANAELRRRLGEAGRQRARETFDWAAIIPRYEDLWGQLAELRRAGTDQPPSIWPGRLDPFEAFASYPSRILSPQTVLALGEADVATALKRAEQYRQLAMVRYATAVMPSPAEVALVLRAAASGPAPAAALVQHIPTKRQAAVFRGLVWLVKLGLLKVIP